MDRRQHTRVVPEVYEDALIEIWKGYDSWKGWVLDISASGVRVLMPNFKSFLSPGQTVSGWIFGRTSQEIKIQGRVSWVRANDAGEAPDAFGHFVGLRFDNAIRPPDWVVSATAARDGKSMEQARR